MKNRGDDKYCLTIQGNGYTLKSKEDIYIKQGGWNRNWTYEALILCQKGKVYKHQEHESLC